MAFDPMRPFDRLRHQREQSRADAALPAEFPILDEIAARAPQHASQLKPIYNHYVEDVSSREMAMSFELATFLFGLCELVEPKKILDLGSGFSSFLFRTYASQADDGTTVTSVDDSPEWLDRTREFLEERGLSSQRLCEWAAFSSNGHGTFDLVFHDLGSMETRAEALPAVLNMATQPGFVILDDVHKRGYERVVKQVTDQRDLQVYSLRSHTLDEYGRFSSLALLPA
jgi:predicted O-methyltransferase YrrM